MKSSLTAEPSAPAALAPHPITSASASASDAPLTAEQRNSKIARDSIALVASYGLTALVGVAFWVLAARTITPAQLGIDTALISAYTAAATIAGTGLANAFLALLPHAGTARTALLREGYLIAIATATGCGAIAGTLAATYLPGAHSLPTTITAMTAATIIWTLFVVQDPVLTAAGRSHWLLLENLPVNLAKLALLPILATTITTTHPAAIAALAPAAAAVLIVSGYLIPRLLRTDRPTDRTDRVAAARTATTWMTHNRHAFRLFVLRDGTASALNLGSYMALPFVVTIISGPVDGAVFALCLQLAAGLDLVTAGIGVSLTTNVSTDPTGAAHTAIRVWRKVIILVTAAALALIGAAPLLLHAFGTTYRTHHGLLIITVLAAGGVLRTTFEVWTALLRAQQRTALLLRCNTIGAILLFTAVITLARHHGATGAAIGVTLATTAFSAAGAIGLWHGRHPTTPTPTNTPTTNPTNTPVTA